MSTLKTTGPRKMRCPRCNAVGENEVLHSMRNEVVCCPWCAKNGERSACVAVVAPKELPILFKAPMVRAILEGRKTQTRRLVKPQPTEHPDPARGDVGFEWPSSTARSMVDVRDMGGLSPYGVPGDRLWVKETHRFESWDEHGCTDLSYVADDARRRDVFVDVRDFDDWSRRQAEKWKRAGAELLKYDEEVDDNVEADDSDCGESCWWQMPSGVRAPMSVSIHMPRWASRILLEVTEVRVERLQSITNADAIAEGIEPVAFDWRDYGRVDDDASVATARESFRTLWESINGPDSWAASPWVWVVGFKVVEVRR